MQGLLGGSSKGLEEDLILGLKGHLSVWLEAQAKTWKENKLRA